jgi:hypothetical protein
VWTPKRILIMIAGTFLFLAGFVIYDYFLGGFDGLPPLPEEYLKTEGTIPLLPPDDSERDQKMRIAFGADSDEARREFIFNSAKRGMLLAVDKFEIQDDGRVRLSPFSVALFPKHKDDALVPEINTIQSEVAYLTLDQPVKTFGELSTRRIIGIELLGNSGVTIVNNRHTPEKNDDIEVKITLAPVYYQEIDNKIWSDGFVKLLDSSSQPHPTEITAKGLEVQLAKDTQPLRSKNAPVKNSEAVGGVESVLLKKHVEMHLYVDAQNGFMADTQDPKKKAAPPSSEPKAVAEKAHVIVKTAGSMHYDLTKELAVFDVPPLPPGAGPGDGEKVHLTRDTSVAGKGKLDQLECDNLKLTFRKKTAAEVTPGAAKDSLAGNKEIDSALATVNQPGREVTLAMDSENLEAWGSELFYHSATATSGPRTVLKGAPMHAIRDGNTIVAQELHLFGPDKRGGGQHAFAKGPGKIDMLDKNLETEPKQKTGEGKAKSDDSKPPYTIHAIWKDNLISVKDRDGDKVYDLLTLTGDAAFIDDEHKQSLQGQRLQVWFEQTNGPEGNKQKSEGGSRQTPHKVEAFERVTVHSEEMQVERCHHLTIVFKEVAAKDDQLPPPTVTEPLTPAGKGSIPPANPMAPPAAVIPIAPANPPAGASPPTVELKSPQPDTKTPAPAGNERNGIFNMPGNSGDKDKPRKPFHIWADDIVAYVTTQGTKKQLEELVTEGNVHVQQDGETPQDKGIDITGEMLNLIYNPLGNRLLVHGTRSPAQLQVGELTVVGPRVDVDQKDNIATVDGVGAMRMPSNTNFDNNKPVKDGTYITIHWNKNMLFNGKFAEFFGGVKAYQDTGNLKCHALQVTLDRFVSFKDGQKEKQNAKVEKLVCDRQVFVEDETRSPEGKRLTYKRLTGTAMDVDNPEGRVMAYGPGTAITIGAGETDTSIAQPGAPKAPSPPPPKNAKADEELKFTRVDFKGRMFGTNKPGVRYAKFYEDIDVYHQPGDDPDVRVSPNQPAKDGFYMRCEQLHVSTVERDGKATQYMVAERNCFFRTPEFYGNADSIKYDESQETILFEGNPTTLFKLGPAGTKAQPIQGKRILYNRKNGKFELRDGTMIQSGWREPNRGTEVLRVSARARNSARESLFAGFDFDGQHEPLVGLGLVAGDDRQVFAAHGPVDDLALFRSGDRQADLIVLVGAVLDDDLGGHVLDQLESRLLVGRQ